MGNGVGGCHLVDGVLYICGHVYTLLVVAGGSFVLRELPFGRRGGNVFTSHVERGVFISHTVRIVVGSVYDGTLTMLPSKVELPR